MSWINKILKIGQKVQRIVKQRPSKDEINKSDWTSCCAGPVLKSDLAENLWVCSICNKHHRISCIHRFDIFFGKNNYEILDTPAPVEDPLNWTDSRPYKERLKLARKKTGQKCAVMIARGSINGINITCGAINFEFMGGSVAMAEGEAIIHGVQHAIDNKNPFVFFPCGGGQRMHESPFALSQMARTTLAINELKSNYLPYIIVFTDPTAGGITASFASLSDIALAENKDTLIAFSGKRVIQATINEQLPENFQRAGRVLECGFVDLIIDRKDIKNTVGKLLNILLNKNSTEVAIEDKNENQKDSQQVTSVAS